MSMTCIEACRLINEVRDENSLVVITMSTMKVFSQVAPGPHNLSSVPLMGGAAGLGLGLALSNPDRQIIVLDGDASLLLELGSLATIAGQQPTNLHHFVFDNRVQFAGVSNLARPAPKTYFPGLAEAAGYTAVEEFDGLDEFESRCAEVLSRPGPTFSSLKIEAPQDVSVPVLREFPTSHMKRLGVEARAMMSMLGTLPVTSQ